MASPLTVCLVVIGKHVPGLAFIGTLMADSGVLAPDTGYYQRLLARDQGEAAEMIDRHIAVGPPDSVFDALMVPALGYAERDRIEERLSPDEEAAIIEATRELLADVAEERRLQPVGASPAPAPLDVLGYAVGGPADEVALAMLAQVCADLPLRIEITRTRLRPAELIAAVRAGGFSVVCFADLPPSPSSKTRYFVKRLRAALPDVHIAVGRWGPPILADEGGEALLSAGASHLASTLIDSRDYLGRLSVVTPS
jgi:hypothetical protein